MRVKDAGRILNVSRATVHNWIRSGKLRLNKTLPNGYRDIEESSVYDAVASTYEPDSPENRVVAFSKDGSVFSFSPDDETLSKVVAYLSELQRLNRV